MNPDVFDKLTPLEREELALCGISTPEQLRNCTVQQLLRDLNQAQQYFPDKSFTLTEERLSAISLEEKPAAYTPTPSIGIPGLRSAKPTTGYKQRSYTEEFKSRKKDAQNNVIMHSPVRCTHPFTALMAAFFTLFLLVPLISIVAFPVLMITDSMPDLPVEILGAIILVVPCLVYLLIARKATCPVCHMRIFRFSHYNRNRAAHYLPILGYNFTTALHVLFFWRYNCPGCGTPVKLTGTKGHRTHC